MSVNHCELERNEPTMEGHMVSSTIRSHLRVSTLYTSGPACAILPDSKLSNGETWTV